MNARRHRPLLPAPLGRLSRTGPAAPARRAALGLVLAWVAAAGLGGPAWAQGAAAAAPAVEPPWTDKGFSYFIGIARQDLTYRESVSILPVNSRAKVSNPLLVSGALYEVSQTLLFSLDNETTFAPSTSTERWTATSGTLNGTALTSSLVQTNRFRLSDSTTKLQGYYRLQGPWFVVAGPAFHSQSFRRFGFKAGPDQATDVTSVNTVEETAAEVLWHVGAALESERVRASAQHYSLRASVALPLWRRMESTAQPDTTFSKVAGGYDLSLEGRYSRAVREHVHLGAWTKYAVSHRSSERQGQLELPRSRLDNLSYGIELLWKL